MRTTAAISLTLATSLAFAAPALAANPQEGAPTAFSTGEQGVVGKLIPKLEDTETNRRIASMLGAESLIDGKVKLEVSVNPQILPYLGIGSPFSTATQARSAMVGSAEARIVTGNASFGNWMFIARDNATGLSGFLGRIGYTRNVSPFDGVRIEPGIGLGYLGVGADDGRGNMSTLTAWNGVAATLNVIGRPQREWPWRYNVNANYTHMLATGGNLFGEVGVDYLPSVNFLGGKTDLTLGLSMQAFMVGQFAGNWSPAIRLGFGL